jgi:hypothetical protein
LCRSSAAFAGGAETVVACRINDDARLKNIPQRLKPLVLCAFGGTTEGEPFQGGILAIA